MKPIALLAVSLGLTGRLAAQAPVQDPPPPRPATAVVPAPPAPAVAPRPPAPVPAAPARAATPATAAPPAAPSRPGPPPDSAPRIAFRPMPLPPANAVAQCKDGVFVTAPADPSACSAHGGVHIALPHRAAPPTPAVQQVTTAPASVQAPGAPPAGATMLCKDGTYLTGAPGQDRCAGNGGLAAILPAAPQAPPPPRRRSP